MVKNPLAPLSMLRGMTIGRVAMLAGIALGVMAANIAVSILYMVVYSYAIDPGHEQAYYQAHVQIAAPYCSIVAGIPLLFLVGWWVGPAVGRHRLAGLRRHRPGHPSGIGTDVDWAFSSLCHSSPSWGPTIWLRSSRAGGPDHERELSQRRRDGELL